MIRKAAQPAKISKSAKAGKSATAGNSAKTGESAKVGESAKAGKTAKTSNSAKAGKSAEPVIDWLLQGDQAIRWQVLRDLTDASAAEVDRERNKLPRAADGWTARLLAKQDPEGTWAGGKSSDGGLYSPKWISTTYTMLLLRDIGLPPTNPGARKACTILLDKGLQRDGGINYDWNISETCITGMILSILSYFEIDDDRLERIASYLLDQQMPDGGWNCRRRLGATHASVHTTISALEGLRHYELHQTSGNGSSSGSKRTRSRRGSRVTAAVRAAQARGREFLLAHRLFRSHRTGAIIKPVFLLLSFPPRWHYDILRGLDYFQSVDAPYDERLTDAIDILRGARDADGRWPLQNSYKGKTYFEMERLGRPSRWNTLRALRVLIWWDRQTHRAAI